jgi:hypothetical protein
MGLTLPTLKLMFRGSNPDLVKGIFLLFFNSERVLTRLAKLSGPLVAKSVD